MEREEQIRCLAYSIWEKEGYPDGRAMEHWLKAETIWQSNKVIEDGANGLKPPQQKRATRSRSVQKRTNH